MRGTTRLAAALGLLMVLVAGALPAHAAEQRTFTVWDWNITGNIWHQGSTTDGIVAAVVDSIIDSDADFASLNEVCWNQYKAIQTQLAARGWPASADFARFAATRDDPVPGLCNGAETFGQALFSRADLGNSHQYVLPDDGKLGTKKLLCAPLQADPLMKFCTVHITTVTGAAAPQLNRVLELLNGFHAAGETYLIAGDFNAQPHYDRLNGYYAPSVNTTYNADNTGAHRELDDADPANCPGYGAWTADVEPDDPNRCAEGWWKVDSIFVRESRIVGAYEAEALDVPRTCTGQLEGRCSDHRAIVGTVTVRIG